MLNLYNQNKKINFKFYFKLILIISFILICFITSFRTGQKFFLISNTQFDESNSIIDTGVAKWYFNAKIVYKGGISY